LAAGGELRWLTIALFILGAVASPNQWRYDRT